MRPMPAILLAVFLLVGPVQAQEPATLAEQLHAAVEEAQANLGNDPAFSMFRQLDRAIADSQRYAQSMAAASVEDSLVLELQFQGALDRFIEAMGQLRGQAGRQDAPEELTASLIRLHQVVEPFIWQRIEVQRARITDLRAERTEAAPQDLAFLEVRIGLDSDRLLVMLGFLSDHLATMRQLGLDVSAQQARYHDLLLELGDQLSGRMQLAQRRAAKANDLIKEKPNDEELKLRAAANREDLTVTTTTMRGLLELMDRAGITPEELRSQVVSMTRDLTSGVLDVKVGATLARKAWTKLTDWLSQEGPGYLAKILVVLIIMTIGWLVSRLVHKAVEKSLERAKLNISQLLKRTIVTFAHNVVLAVAIMIALAQFGISLGPLLAGLGVVGFILGFAMQDSLSNFAAGLMILFYRPYDVGDLVEISGVFGRVEHMSMVSTSVLTLDNQKLVVPNSKIWGDVIKNVTDQRVRRVDMTFGISYSDDIPHAEKVLNDILAENDLVLDEPEPMVRLHTLNESSVDFVVRPWVKTDDYWNVYWAVTREVKMRFDAEKISIPFPQRDVHLYPTAKENQAEA